MVLPVKVTVKDITEVPQQSHGHGRPAVLLTRDWNCQKHAHTHATLRRQAQYKDDV